MRIAFDHGGFQRRAAAVVAVGGERGRALCQRAAVAATKIRSAAAGARAGEAAEVEAVARRVVLEIVALSRRQRSVAREAEAPSAGELDARIADLDRQAAAVTDEV